MYSGSIGESGSGLKFLPNDKSYSAVINHRVDDASLLAAVDGLILYRENEKAQKMEKKNTFIATRRISFNSKYKKILY